MTRAYWDALAGNYEEQIFSVLQHDRGRRVADCVNRYGRVGGTGADLGCGPGQALPMLARRFGQVHACDHSLPLLQRARRSAAEWANVHFHHVDLAADEAVPFAPVDLALCINVLLTPDLRTRERLWNSVSSVVAEGGVLLLVVPSLESALYTNFRRLDWHVRAGVEHEFDARSELGFEGPLADAEQGVRLIEGVPTKHYLREEIIVQLGDRGLEVAETIQLTYAWTAEFADPPDWMAAPYPWNWLVVARRPE